MAHPSSGFSRLVPVPVLRLQFDPDMLAKTPVIGAEDVVRSMKSAETVRHQTLWGSRTIYVVGWVNIGLFCALGDLTTLLSWRPKFPHTFRLFFFWWCCDERCVSSGCQEKMKVILSPLC